MDTRDRLTPPPHVHGWKRLRYRALGATAEVFGFLGRAFRRAGLGDPGVRLFQLALVAVPPAIAMALVGASLAVALGASLAWFLLIMGFLKLGRVGADSPGWAIILYTFTAIVMVPLLASVMMWIG